MSSGSKECWFNETDAPKPKFKEKLVNIEPEIRGVKYKPYKSQVGGEHYQKAIQPMLFISSNNLNFSVGNVVKYVCRHEQKNGKQDLIKAIHYAMFEAYHKYPDEYDEFVKAVNNLNGTEQPEEDE